MGKGQNHFSLQFYMKNGDVHDTIFNIRLIYILSGDMAVHSGTESFVAHTGDFFALNVGQDFYGSMRNECLYAQLEIQYGFFAERMNTSYVYILCNSVLGNMDGFVHKEVKNVLSQLIREYARTSSVLGFRREYLWYRLMDTVSRNCMFVTTDASELTDPEQRMLFVMQYICANYASELLMEQVSDLFHLSVSSFSRWFKKQSGMNYSDFVHQVRITHAVDDLLHTDKTITNIAVDNGFSNSSVFTKFFRKKYGCTPSTYRLEKHNRKGADIEEILCNVRQSSEFMQCENKAVTSQVCRIYAKASEGAVWQSNWNRAINAGEGADLFSAKMQAQILDLKKQLGFKYVRIGNIFSKKLRIRKGHSVINVNYDGLDSIFDFIVVNGMHPMIDLGDRERIGFLAMNEFLYHEQPEGVFASEDEMMQLLSDMFRHFVFRYGVKEVSRWIIECWYDDRSDRVIGLKENYARIFQKISALLKSIVPGILVGGCGLELGISEKFFRNIVKELAYRKCIPDFISIYIYPYEDLDSQISDFNYMTEKLSVCRNILKQYHMEHLDIYVTEWNLSVSVRNYYNDSCAKASMLLSHAITSFGSVQMVVYSMLSDLTANYFDSSRLLFGAPGLLNKDGLYKPVYYALRFLGDMEGHVLSSGPEHLLTISDDGIYHLLLFCARALNYKYYMKKEYNIKPSELKELFEDESELQIHLELTDVPDGEYLKKSAILDMDNGSLLDQWVSMGMPEVLTVRDIEYLKNVTQPKIVFHKLRVASHVLHLQETLLSHQVQYIEIYPQK